jgi:hypothetical protein
MRIDSRLLLGVFVGALALNGALAACGEAGDLVVRPASAAPSPPSAAAEPGGGPSAVDADAGEASTPGLTVVTEVCPSSDGRVSHRFPGLRVADLVARVRSAGHVADFAAGHDQLYQATPLVEYEGDTVTVQCRSGLATAGYVYDFVVLTLQ